MARERRAANYELLRIVAMVMVVVMHFLARSEQMLALDEPFGSVRLRAARWRVFAWWL